MTKKDLKIGLAFSGGGFRASAFSLGVLSYLNEVMLKDNTRLLTKVYALSTVSGGTITGTRYAIGIKRGETFNQIYWAIYNFMSKTDLVNISLDNLTAKRTKSDTRARSLIAAFADTYNEHLFDNEKFGVLLDEDKPIHLKHISFNATEFTYAQQFRFQKTEKTKESSKIMIANFYYRIPENVVKEVRMGDILAASSCFPGGFEPINFPDDFYMEKNIDFPQINDSIKYPVGLMDGGIVDNQGIEPLLLAEKRMKPKRTAADSEHPESNAFDLLIISDVASPFMDPYKAKKVKTSAFLKTLNFRKVLLASHVVLILSLLGLYYSIKINSQPLDILFTVFITISLVTYLLLNTIKKLPRKFSVPDIFMKPINKLLKVKLSVYINLLLNRFDSLLKVAGDVFLKHIRSLNYDKVYQDRSWKNRRIMNAIYELKGEKDNIHKKIKNGELNKELMPSSAVQQVALTAASMGTTLWFTKDELKKENMLNSIIACGQFTMCWNLLEYINNIKKDPENTNENHRKLIQIEDPLLEHWQKFNKDPFWLVNIRKTKN